TTHFYGAIGDPQIDDPSRLNGTSPGYRSIGERANDVNSQNLRRAEKVWAARNDVDRFDDKNIGRLNRISGQHDLVELARHVGKRHSRQGRVKRVRMRGLATNCRQNGR